MKDSFLAPMGVWYKCRMRLGVRRYSSNGDCRWKITESKNDISTKTNRFTNVQLIKLPSLRYWFLGTVKTKSGQGGQHSTMFSILTSRPSCPGFNSQHSSFFSEEIIGNSAKVNQQRCFVESGLWLENVDRTHLVLASSTEKSGQQTNCFFSTTQWTNGHELFLNSLVF